MLALVTTSLPLYVLVQGPRHAPSATRPAGGTPGPRRAPVERGWPLKNYRASTTGLVIGIESGQALKLFHINHINDFFWVAMATPRTTIRA
jgi:hypothetical protein